MAYVDISTLMTIAAGEVLTAAVVQQIRDNEEFLIDPPACSIKESTPQSVNNASATALTSNEENYDNDAMHSTASNTSRITIQTAGRYDVSAVVEFATDGDGPRAIQFIVNSGTTYDIMDVAASSTTERTVLSGSRTLVLAAGDYVELLAYHVAGAALNVTMLEFAAVFFTR